MELSKTLIAVILGAILLILGFLGARYYFDYAEKQKFIQVLKTIESEVQISISKDGYEVSNCGIDTKGMYFDTKPKELMVSNDWLGLKADLDDCSLSVQDGFNSKILADEFRIVVENTGDIAGIKIIWKDVNQNLIADTNERLGSNYKEYIETYLKNAILNSL